jgi:hypothetical protein
MRDAAIFMAGVATGWVLRSSFDSFRDVTVRGMSVWFDANERLRRFVAVEREYFEDIVAEARSRFEASRARRTGRAGSATTPTARA